jgi:hypoxanthine phosphoribosyltransferase
MSAPSLAKALETAEVVHDIDVLEEAIEDIADAIRADYADDEPPPLFVTIMHGGMPFAAQLAFALGERGLDLEFDDLHATRYRGNTSGSGLAWLHRPATPMRGRRVLLADDILDEGHTLHAIIEFLKAEGARDVRSAVLTHKLHERKAYPGMRADFTGLDVADRFLFGCGMDYKGYWRNAPGIYAVKGL